MTHFKRVLTGLTILLICLHPIFGQETENETKKTIEAPSPDGKFAFRYGSDSDKEKQTYELIDKQSGKLVTTVTESDPDLGASARFHMDVLWRLDSKAFALTATLIKLGSEVTVFMRDGSTFRKIKLPAMGAEITDKAKKGKSFPHIAELDSHRAVQWQKDGSLVMEIENIQDGEAGSITATRTVVLTFDRFDKAKVLKSTIKFTFKKPEDE